MSWRRLVDIRIGLPAVGVENRVDLVLPGDENLVALASFEKQRRHSVSALDAHAGLATQVSCRTSRPRLADETIPVLPVWLPSFRQECRSAAIAM